MLCGRHGVWLVDPGGLGKSRQHRSTGEPLWVGRAEGLNSFRSFVLALRVKTQDPNWTPWSEWITAPGSGARLSMAMPSAFVVNAAVGEESIAHPTTRREHTSSTTAQYTLPSRVGCSV